MEAAEKDDIPRLFEPCASVSPEAHKFMTQSAGATWQVADLSPEGVAILRSDNSAAGASAWELVRQECTVTLEEEIVGGTSCQWVSPVATGGPEIILYLFGGGFVVGSPEDDLSMSARIACYTDRRVCVPRYSLAPENPFPAARDEVRAVYSALSERKCDIYVVGESAGGNLALGLVLGVCADPGELPRPRAVALFSPWIDLTHSGDSHATGFGLDPTLSVKHFLEPASLVYAGLRDTSDSEISPLFAEIPSGFPPTLISTATRDLLLSDSVRLAQKLRAKNCPVDFRVTEGLWHVFEWYPPCPEAVASLLEISKFLTNFFR